MTRVKQKIEVNLDELRHFTDKQTEASIAVNGHKFVLYGGAMGGGKSFFLRWKLLSILLALAARGKPNVTVGLFCEDYPALKDRHIHRVKSEFPSWLGEYREADHNFILKPEFGGGIIAFRNLDDASKYQSTEFAAIAVDELTKVAEEDFIDLRTRLRWPGINNPKFIGATNPGGRGHLWVKKLWIDRQFPEYEQERDEFVYVKAVLADNPYINDPNYLKSLESLPIYKRKAFVEGNWDVFEGQYFEEWDPTKHVINSFQIPDDWPKYRSIDPSGQNGITSCHWYAVNGAGDVFVYKEHYGKGLNAHEHARQIKKMSGNEEYQYTTIDSSADANTGHEETMLDIYRKNGVDNLWPSGKQQRVAGWDIVREYLKHTLSGKPFGLYVFRECKHLIRTLPALEHDIMNSDDVDTTGEDHAEDELRYILQSLRGQRAPDKEESSQLNAAQKRMLELYGHL
jgi:phage terminase large subunit